MTEQSNEPIEQPQSAPTSDAPRAPDDQQPLDQAPEPIEPEPEAIEASSVEGYELEMPGDIPPSRIAEWEPVLEGFGQAAATAGLPQTLAQEPDAYVCRCGRGPGRLWRARGHPRLEPGALHARRRRACPPQLLA